MQEEQGEVDKLAQIIWDYHHMHHPLEKADMILVLGSNDTRVAEHGAGLWLQGYAPYILFSGGFGRLTESMFHKPEAEIFADMAQKMGVPQEKILIENRSTNTGENIDFTRELLREKGMDPATFILVQKPYMERRAYATFKMRWPEKEFVVTSPELSYTQYPNETITRELLINITVGDLQRIRCV